MGPPPCPIVERGCWSGSREGCLCVCARRSSHGLLVPVPAFAGLGVTSCYRVIVQCKCNQFNERITFMHAYSPDPIKLASCMPAHFLLLLLYANRLYCTLLRILRSYRTCHCTVRMYCGCYCSWSLISYRYVQFPIVLTAVVLQSTPKLVRVLVHAIPIGIDACLRSACISVYNIQMLGSSSTVSQSQSTVIVNFTTLPPTQRLSVKLPVEVDYKSYCQWNWITSSPIGPCVGNLVRDVYEAAWRQNFFVRHCVDVDVKRSDNIVNRHGSCR